MTDLPLSFAAAHVSREARQAAVDEWNKGSADTTQMLLAVAAAAPVIERQVRERIAADIEAELPRRSVAADGALHTAARIARGGAA